MKDHNMKMTKMLLRMSGMKLEHQDTKLNDGDTDLGHHGLPNKNK